MRAIIVPVADRPECAHALVAAFDLATLVSGNVLGYHVRPHKAESRTAEPGSFSLRTNSDWQRALSAKQIGLDSRAARAFFARQVEQHGFEPAKHPRYAPDGKLAVWHEMLGSPEQVFAIIGPLADLIVVSRPKRKKSTRARSFMMSALMYSNRPVLMLPQRKLATVGKRIVIAWNQSAEAAAAVTAALPVLQQAEHVVIASAGAENRVGPKSTSLQRYLKMWNVKASVKRLPGKKPADELLRCYERTEADLLVMGAYSRGHWRETIFGGLTDRILHHTDLPVLTLHS